MNRLKKLKLKFTRGVVNYILRTSTKHRTMYRKLPKGNSLLTLLLLRIDLSIKLMVKS